MPELQTGPTVRTLETRLTGLDGPRRALAERLSLYRAFFTAAAELADIADDSFGYLGDLRTETWLEYLDIDWRTASMAPVHYWTDLCGLYVGEDYGIDHRNERAWFRSAELSDRPLIDGVLTGIAVEAGSYVLDYQADRAHVGRSLLQRTPSWQHWPPVSRTESKQRSGHIHLLVSAFQSSSPRSLPGKERAPCGPGPGRSSVAFGQGLLTGPTAL